MEEDEGDRVDEFPIEVPKAVEENDFFGPLFVIQVHFLIELAVGPIEFTSPHMLLGTYSFFDSPVGG